MLRSAASRGLRRFSSGSPHIVSVTSRDQFEKLVELKGPPVIVDFYADWCALQPQQSS